ncbi:MAG: hypothetical protein DRP47_04020, partial [Candidatus Zixiibacteriota bacterium]
VYGFGTSILDIPAIQNKIPTGAIISKAAGVAGAAADWGISIYDMYTAADTGDGKKFAYSVVSYGGKGLVMGGAVLLLTPLAPLGAVLVAVGTAVNVVGSLVEAIIDYKDVDEKMFIELMTTKLKENDPTSGKEIADLYEHLSKRTKVKNTKAIAMAKEQFPQYIVELDDVVDDLTFEEYIHKFFLNMYWGVQYEVIKK